MTFPLKWVITWVMWLFIAARRSSGSVRLETQLGSCEYQTSVCPLTFIPWASAKSTTASAAAKVKFPRVGSVASHFISFSGVT